MSHLAFLLSILLFCGPIALLIWHREQRMLKKYELVLLIMIVLSVIFVGPADFYALRWGAWKYGADVTSDIYLLTLPETYLFGIAVTGIVAAVTLVFAAQIDRQHRLTARAVRKYATARSRRRQSS